MATKNHFSKLGMSIVAECRAVTMGMADDNDDDDDDDDDDDGNDGSIRPASIVTAASNRTESR
jgi:hypothetical protein